MNSIPKIQTGPKKKIGTQIHLDKDLNLGSLGIHPHARPTQLAQLPYDAIILILTPLYLSRNVTHVEWCARFFYWPCHLLPMLACPFRTGVALFSTPINMEKYLCYRTRTEENLSLNEVRVLRT